MNAATAAKRTLGALFATAMLSAACAGSAFAATVHGADCYGTGGELAAGKVDVLDVDGNSGETVFLSVTNGERAIAKNLPYTLGEDTSDASSGWTGVATLDISGFDTNKLDGSYQIKAYSSRAGDELLYEGAIYGVYADLDGDSKLIGTRTLNSAEAASRAYQPPETLYVDGQSYKLESDEPKGAAALHYSYEAYDEATTIDGAVKYVDAQGTVVATTKVPGMAHGASETVELPSVVAGEDGTLYRTVHFKDSVTLKNPGETTATVYCTLMSQADKAASGFYVATIKMVDEKGNVIATDTVDVTGKFLYTAPSAIYKTITTDTATGETAAVAYKIDGSQTVALDAATDGVVTGARTVTVKYSTVASDAANVDVTFKLIDGSKRAGEDGRVIGTSVAKAMPDDPTVNPPATAKSGEATLNIVGEPADYAYTLHSGEQPLVDVYYLPEGFEAPAPYDVTVNYVNFTSGKVVGSQTVTSSPDDAGAISIETPKTFEADGVEYIRLDGQDDAISHSFYSYKETYTVYYRDKNDTLTSGTVINRLRTVYVDAEPTAASAPSPAAGESAANATAASQGESAESAPAPADEVEGAPAPADEAGADEASADDATTGGGAIAADGAADAGDAADAGEAAAGDDAVQDLALDDDTTYNVFDGEDNNATLTNEEGVDSNTERIEDNENPLASGIESPDAPAEPSVAPAWVLPVSMLAAIALVVVCLIIVMKRRRDVASAPVAEATDTAGDVEK